MLSEIPRKSLTKIARAVGLKDSQGLNYFLSLAHWNVEKVREIRLWLTKLFIGEREITLCLDETGDVKTGKTTDDNWSIKWSVLRVVWLRGGLWIWIR
jgi:SRSO17 transposase